MIYSGLFFAMRTFMQLPSCIESEQTLDRNVINGKVNRERDEINGMSVFNIP